MTTRRKYPRTFHLPWSQGATADDKTLKSVSHLEGCDVVVTEKMDGENTTIYSDGYLHARSLDGRSHPSQAYVRALAAQVGPNIPQGWRVCGENVYARHSLGYDNLSNYFYVFAIYDEHNVCLSWEDTEDWAALLDLPTVPIRYEGLWDEEAIKACYDGTSAFGNEGEGYVVRIADCFPYEAFSRSVAKFVRANHVQEGSAHWKLQTVVPNTLKS